MASDSDKAEGAASSLSDQIARTLGLSDIAYGGLALYLIWLLLGPDVRAVFPRVGEDYLDAAILLATAAITGRLMFFAAAVVQALVGLLIVRRAKYEALTSVLNTYRQRVGLTSVESDNNTDRALAVLARTWPKRMTYLEALGERPKTTYAAVVLAVLLLVRLLIGGLYAPGLIALGAIAGLFVLGVVYQLDFVQEITNHMETVNGVPVLGGKENAQS